MDSAMLRQLEEIEIQMDEANGIHGNEEFLCIFCESSTTNAQGIVHSLYCGITRIRKLIRTLSVKNGKEDDHVRN